jgi:hypothetical protein
MDYFFQSPDIIELEASFAKNVRPCRIVVGNMGVITVVRD